MPGFSRRQFLGMSLAGMAGGVLSGCASTSGSTRRQPVAESSRLQLLFYADTHAQWLPVHPHPAACHLGPMSLLGQPPYLTEQDRLQALGLAEGSSAAAWLTATGARQQPPRLMGGYALLAEALQARREEAGGDASLTLEGGQCWNGSGLAQLTEGRYGPLSSHWLGADVRVASEETQLWPQAAEGLYQEFARPVVGGSKPVHLFQRSDVRIAVVGVMDPWLGNKSGVDEQVWLQSLQQQVDEANAQASLVILLCDAGTNPAFWLAQRLKGVDLVLASRGQDLWPVPLSLHQGGQRSAPVCLAGSQGLGFHELQLHYSAGQWQIDARFHPLWVGVEAASESVDRQIRQLRAPYAGWLDQPLAVTPGWLYRRDALAGSWDQLIAEALKGTGAELTLSPGLRHGVALPPGSTIRREHLLSLTAGYPAAVFNVPANRNQLQSRLEAGADQLLGDDLWLHTSEDMPRLTGSHYILRYQAQAGQRIADLEWPVPSTSDRVRLAGWSTHYQGEGAPLWQVLERWLRDRRANWSLPEIEKPSLAFVEGHPGWHPEALL